MGLHIMIAAKYVLEGMFFVGLIGCTSTVILSWISVLRDALTPGGEESDQA